MRDVGAVRSVWEYVCVHGEILAVVAETDHHIVVCVRELDREEEDECSRGMSVGSEGAMTRTGLSLRTDTSRRPAPPRDERARRNALTDAAETWPRRVFFNKPRLAYWATVLTVNPRRTAAAL